MKTSFSAGFDCVLGPFKRVFLDFKKLLEMGCFKSIRGGECLLDKSDLDRLGEQRKNENLPLFHGV